MLPLGTKIRITGTASYDGNYLVTDNGAAVKGMHIDIYIPSEAEAKQFGTKRVRVQIRQMGTGGRGQERYGEPLTRAPSIANSHHLLSFRYHTGNSSEKYL